MKWYGFTKIKSNKYLTNNKSYLKKKLKKNIYTNKLNFNLKFCKINFYLPCDWYFLLLKKNNYFLIYIYSHTYFFILPFIKKFLNFNYDIQLNLIILQFFFYNNFYYLFWIWFKLIFYSFSKIFFKKLKFKGKGYYIYKNKRNTIALQFGYSHLLYLYGFFLTVKFLTKTTVFIFGINNKDLLQKTKMFYNIKKINIFTGKGIRFSRQILYRKTGKISSYR